jgi:lipoprotein-anchoring transpeptidase ErfK/SrfK
MKKIKPGVVIIAGSILLGAAILFVSCNADHKQRLLAGFSYHRFKDSLSHSTQPITYDTTNIFDSTFFTPGKDSLDTLLLRLDTLWSQALSQLEKPSQTKTMTDSAALMMEKQVLAMNRQSIDSFLTKKDLLTAPACREKECLLYAEVIKSKQVLYLYLESELVDSFAVSTGISGRETPNLNLKPSGPVFTKYTSTKFPGGNYQGLGNMPYAVFVKGGYAIHGTTQGNFSKLGSTASHGCIRLHPDNAKLFNELVKKVGLENTWVRVAER